MKALISLTMLFLTSYLFAQVEQDTLGGVDIVERLSGLNVGVRTIYSENDSIPVVVKIGSKKVVNNALWYLNGQVVDEQILRTTDPDNIEHLRVEKEIIVYKDARYNGSIYVQTIENYKPRFISLNAIKEKHLNIFDSVSTLFLLDGEVINADYDQFMVDENYILKIEVQAVNREKENLDITVVGLITRTKENLEKANTIRIR